MCRKSAGASNIAISEQHLNSCWKTGSFYTSPAADGTTQVIKPADTWYAADGCDGGSALTAWVTMATEGRVSRWADPYTAQGGSIDRCGTFDTASLQYKVATDSAGVRVFKLPANNFDLIKQAIVSTGTVAASFTVYNDIMQLHGSTIYTKSATAVQSGGHAVAVIGYGTEGTQAYWIFANSWGTGNPSNPSALAL